MHKSLLQCSADVRLRGNLFLRALEVRGTVRDMRAGMDLVLFTRNGDPFRTATTFGLTN